MANNISHDARVYLGVLLTGIRVSKKISKYRIAKITGLTQEQVNNIEKGKSSYTVDSLLSYVAALDCEIDISS